MAFNELSTMFDASFPIFAFSHCRDVVVEVSRAGGVGVLGAARMSPEALRTELKHTEQVLGPAGLPYGVDLLFPLSSGPDPDGPVEVPDVDDLPKKQLTFAREVASRLGSEEQIDRDDGGISFAGAPVITRKRAREMADIALSFPIRTLVSGLGPVPEDIAERCKDQGVLIGGLVGDPKHALVHQAAGADFIIAEGTEAGGHTGPIATSVLVPDVVDAVAPLPVLAAGGIGTGRQIAAALAWGAQGVWIGSIWLTSHESDVEPYLQDRLLKAGSKDAVTSKVLSGKTIRMLRNEWTDAWEADGAPPTLPMPLQGVLSQSIMTTAMGQRNPRIATTPVGQIVSRMNSQRRTAELMHEMLTELLETLERLGGYVSTE